MYKRQDQILTQVKGAAAAAREAGTADGVLEILFRNAAAAGKEIKTKVPLTGVPRSAAQSAVERLARDCLLYTSGADLPLYLCPDRDRLPHPPGSGVPAGLSGGAPLPVLPGHPGLHGVSPGVAEGGPGVYRPGAVSYTHLCCP